MAQDYFVAQTGSDQADGRTVTTAWRSADHAAAWIAQNGLQPGDRVCFQGGGTFPLTKSLTISALNCAGTASKPVTITSFGDGTATLLPQGVTGVSIHVEPSASALHLVVSQLVIRGNQQPTSQGKPAQGISVWVEATAAVAGLRCEDLLLEQCAGDGLSMCRSLQAARVSEVVIRRVHSRDNIGCPNHAPHSGSGIVVGGVTGAVIEQCVAERNGENNKNPGGPVGIWYWDAIDSVIRNCRSVENRTKHGDGGGFDLDGGCERCVIEFCWSERNAGAGYLFAQFDGARAFGPIRDNIVRNNVSVRDGRQDGYGSVHFWGANAGDVVERNTVHHNTFIMAPPVNSKSAVPAGVVLQGPHMRGIQLLANTFLLDGSPLLRSTEASFSDAADAVQWWGNTVITTNAAASAVRLGSQQHSVTTWFSAHDGAGTMSETSTVAVPADWAAVVVMANNRAAITPPPELYAGVESSAVWSLSQVGAWVMPTDLPSGNLAKP